MASLVPIWDKMCPMYGGDRRKSKSTDGRICGHALGCLVEKSQLYWKDLAYEATTNDISSVGDLADLVEVLLNPYKIFVETSCAANSEIYEEFQVNKQHSFLLTLEFV